MKKLIGLCLLFCGMISLHAEERVKPTTKEVTVYLNGAKLHTKGSVSVPSGKSEVVFENLSPNIYAQSLQVKFSTSRVKLVSANFQARFIEGKREDAKIALLQDSLRILGDLSLAISDEEYVYQQEQTMLTNVFNRIINATADSQKTLNPFDINDMKGLPADYQKKLLDVRNRLRNLSFRQREIAEKTNSINQRISNLLPRNQTTTGEIKMQVYAESAQNIDITCIYLVTGASWTPLYDISSEGVEKPVKLTYKGAVRQTSGVDWKDVKVKLSTANPFTNNSRPILNPLYVNYRIVPAYGYNRDVDASYRLAAAPATNMATIATEKESKKLEDIDDEVVFDQRQEGGQQSNQVFVELEVPLLQSIDANGQDQIVEVETYDIPAAYQYHAVPKMESSVFLLAKVTNYGQYNLMPGNANIFYQNTLIGQSFIDPTTVADTLLLSFGKDENITIKRTKIVDLSSAKIIGLNKKESFGFEITVKNNRAVPINIEILDQVPISNNTEIEVEVEETSKAEYNKDYGKLLWRLDVPAGQSKKVKFSYTIKYPKDKNIGFQ